MIVSIRVLVVVILIDFVLVVDHIGILLDFMGKFIDKVLEPGQAI